MWLTVPCFIMRPAIDEVFSRRNGKILKTCHIYTKLGSRSRGHSFGSPLQRPKFALFQYNELPRTQHDSSSHDKATTLVGARNFHKPERQVVDIINPRKAHSGLLFNPAFQRATVLTWKMRLFHEHLQSDFCGILHR